MRFLLVEEMQVFGDVRGGRVMPTYRLIAAH